jgi:hypothetical protein
VTYYPLSLCLNVQFWVFSTGVCWVRWLFRIGFIVAAAFTGLATGGGKAQDFGLSEIRGGAMIHGVELSGHPNFFDTSAVPLAADWCLSVAGRTPPGGRVHDQHQRL